MEPCTFYPNYEEYPKSTLRKIPYASGTKTLTKAYILGNGNSETPTLYFSL